MIDTQYATGAVTRANARCNVRRALPLPGGAKKGEARRSGRLKRTEETGLTGERGGTTSASKGFGPGVPLTREARRIQVHF